MESDSIIKISFIDRDSFNINVNHFNDYTLKIIIGYGNYGIVYSAINNTNLNLYAIKLEDLKVPKTCVNYILFKNILEKEYNEQVEITKLFDKNNIGPKFINSWIDKELEIGVNIMELWDATLKYVDLTKLDINLIEKFINQIETIHKLGYIHYDIKPQNVLIKYNLYKKIIDITIIDYGLTRKIVDVSKEPLKVFYEYHSEYAPDFYVQLNFSDIEKNPCLIDYGLLYQIEVTNKNSKIGKYPIKLIGSAE